MLLPLHLSCVNLVLSVLGRLIPIAFASNLAAGLAKVR